MNIKVLAPIMVTFLLACGDAVATDGKVTISSPTNGATFSLFLKVNTKAHAPTGVEACIDVTSK